ncbi:MAG: triacylglycerol lipase [Actinomycetota bacterium]|jgi:pimeloyl-ACP methyl ester carboxylesterase
MKRAFVVTLIAALFVGVTAANAEPAHQRPQGPARVGFGQGFPALVDHEWDFPLGGFGGIAPNAARKHAPVIFVHGNNVDHADWYVVRDDFRAAGWTDQELFGLSYNGLETNDGGGTRPEQEKWAEHIQMGGDGVNRLTNNEVNVPDLYDFINAVRTYTGSKNFTLVGHSLGVTVARRTLRVHPELRPYLVAFVGIAGGNHGTSFCPPGSEDQLVSCNEVAADTPWLAALNGPDGNDETYGATKWLTVSDGSGAADPAFAGPMYAASPQLRGAENRTYPYTYHNDLRINAAIVADYRAFIEAADAAASVVTPPAANVAAAAPNPSPATGQIAATGGGERQLFVGLALLGAALAAARLRRKVIV